MISAVVKSRKIRGSMKSSLSSEATPSMGRTGPSREGLEVVRVLLGPGMLVESSAGAAFQTVTVRFVIYGEGIAHMRVPAAEKSSEYSGNRIA